MKPNQIQILLLFIPYEVWGTGLWLFFSISFAKPTLANNTPNLDCTVLFPASLPFLSKSHSLLKQLNLLQMRNILGHEFSDKTWGEI